MESTNIWEMMLTNAVAFSKAASTLAPTGKGVGAAAMDVLPALYISLAAGGFGGLLSGLVKGSDYVCRVPYTGKKVPLGFLADILIGVGGGLAVLLIAAPLFYDALPGRGHDIKGAVVLQFIAMVTVAGFAGPKIVSAMSDKLLNQINSEVAHLKDEVERIEQRRVSEEWAKLGDFHKDRKNYEVAIGFYDKAFDIEPNNVDVVLNKGYCLKRLGRVEEALSLVEPVANQHPSNGRAQYNRACYKAVLNKSVEEVVPDLKKAIRCAESYRQLALTDPDFNSVRDEPKFKELVDVTSA